MVLRLEREAEEPVSSTAAARLPQRFPASQQPRWKLFNTGSVHWARSNWADHGLILFVSLDPQML